MQILICFGVQYYKETALHAGLSALPKVSRFFFPVWCLHCYGEASGLDTCFSTSYGLAWSATSGSVLMPHPILSAIVCPWLNFGLPPRCPQIVWCHWGEIEPFSATLAQDGLAEWDQPGKNPLKYSAVARYWTRATGRTDSELSHWVIMTDSMVKFIFVSG